jgi:peptidoglycan/LPS O-acetylase OafA/YrhL
MSELRSYPALTALRGLAALWVFVYHAWVAAEPRWMSLSLFGSEINLTPYFSLGWIGVDVFFTLSAFLLTLPFAVARQRGTPTPPIGNYLQRRCLRILPAYYVQLLLVLAFIAIVEQRAGLTSAGFMAHLVLFLNLGPQPVPPLVGVWWTLPIEFGYYLLLPLLLPFMHGRRVWGLLVASIALTLAYRYGMFLYAMDRPISSKVILIEQLPGHLDQFVLGSLAAVWIARQPDLGRSLDAGRARALTLIGVALVLLLMHLLHWNSAGYWAGEGLLFCFHLFMGLAIALLVVGLCSDRHPDTRMLRTGPLVFLGTISYSFYLWHQWILFRLLEQDWIDAPTPYLLPMLLLVGGVASLITAWLSWRLIEQPCLAWGRSAFRGPSGHKGDQSGAPEGASARSAVTG